MNLCKWELIYRPRDEDVYVLYNRPGILLGRVALRADRTLFLFIFADDGDAVSTASDLRAQKAVPRAKYGTGAWECAEIVARLEEATDLYFDRVSQIRMEAWSKGRIALVGDAAFCVSLAAGQGSALAVTAAYVLAGELLKANGRHEDAFRAYESRLRDRLAAKQAGAVRFSAAFAPRTRWGLLVRNLIVNAIALPGLAPFIAGREFIDTLAIPDFAWPDRARSAG